MISRAEPVMGTVVSIDVVPGEVPEADARAAIAAACALLHQLDEEFSTWKPDSPMSRLRAGRLDIADAPGEIPAVLELCRQAKELSGGWFDPWALPGGVDPTGLVKGWAASEALAILRRAGVQAALVNAGGDVCGFGRPAGHPWRIGVRHPWRPDALACVLEVEASVATSGTYERGTHLTDPRDGSTPTAVASGTVTGTQLALVDALATALAVAGDPVLEIIRALEGYEAYLISADGTEDATPGIAFANGGSLPTNS